MAPNEHGLSWLVALDINGPGALIHLTTRPVSMRSSPSPSPAASTSCLGAKTSVNFLVLFEIAEPVLNPHTKSQNLLKAIHPMRVSTHLLEAPARCHVGAV